MADEDNSSTTQQGDTGNELPVPINANNNMASPYYLHPGENPITILVSLPLNDTNYYNWCKAMRRVLSSKKKLHFINGRLPPPVETHQDNEVWETINNLVVSWINRSLSPPIAKSKVSIDNARELWLDLQDRFTKGNYFRMSNLLQDLHSMKQGERTLTAFFTDMKILWDKLENLRPTLSCSCAVACTCALSSAIRRFKEVEYVIYFLKGLSDTYYTVHSQILTKEPLPQINKAYAIVSQQEIAPPPIASESTVFAMAPSGSQGCGQQMQGRGRGRNGPKQQMLCTHCKMTNHTVDNCYFKHEFPPGYRTREHASALQNLNEPSTAKPSTVILTNNNSNSDHSLQVSREDYNHLMTLLHSSKKDNAIQNTDPSHIVLSISHTGKIENLNSLWILDYGASDHV